MNSTEKANLYNNTREKIEGLLIEVDTKLDRENSLEILASVLSDYGLDFLAKLVKAEYEPSITTQWLVEECCYDEGNDQAGHISLANVFVFVEEILNTADDGYNFKFDNKTVRLETDEEKEEESHSKNVDWYTADEEIDLKKLIGFTVG